MWGPLTGHQPASKFVSHGFDGVAQNAVCVWCAGFDHEHSKNNKFPGSMDKCGSSAANIGS
jgi:hypothetical protein